MKKISMFYDLGGGIPGQQPKGGLIGGGANSTSGSGMVGGQKRGQGRKILRSAFGNAAYRFNSGRKLFPLIKKQVTPDGTILDWSSGLTPFRQAMNAGDILSKVNSPVHADILPAPANPVRISKSSLAGWKGLAGSVIVSENGSAYSGNPRFVYDGGDYTRFKKMEAINKTYNDKSFGGNNSNAQQSAWRRVHRGF